MQSTVTNAAKQQTKGRMIFLMMAIFFVVPILVVVAMYQYNWKPSGQSRGELVQPPRLLAASTTLMDNKGQLHSKFWNEKWNIVFVAEDCQAVCQQKLHDMRQVYVSTYKDMLRVQRVLITPQQKMADVQLKYPDMIILNQPTQDVAALANQFNIGSEQALLANRTYLVDPLGHIMMSYPQNAPAADILKDLKRLLRFSWAG